jgi:hypothetical protein
MSSSRRDFVAGLGSGRRAGSRAAFRSRQPRDGPLYPPMNLAAFDVPLNTGRPVRPRRLLGHHMERQ